MSLGLSAAAWAGISTVGGLGLGAYSASKSGGGSSQSGTQTVTKQDQLDPRISSMLFGNGTKQLKPGVTPTWKSGQPDANGQTWDTASNPESDYTNDTGLLGRYQSMLGRPQNSGIANFGAQQDGYLGYGAGQDQNHIRETAYGQMQGNIPYPDMWAAGIARTNPMDAAKVNAPAQNGMNLTGSYDHFINGDAGANPYLNRATQGAIDQSTNQFRQMQGDATDNLRRNILPQIGQGAVVAGQYGGSRQGIAEGNAISDFTRQQAQAMTQFGQNNTNQAVGAQASSFNQGQDRALAATQGLGAQQYGVAAQDASQRQQANATNYAGDLQTHLAQAGFDQGASSANLGAKLQTNGLNAQVQQQGVSNLGGVLSTAYANGQNQDSYALNQAGKVNGLLSPYLSANQSSTTSQPLYQNTAGNMMGGLLGGATLGKQIGGLFGGSGTDWNALRNGSSGTDANLTFTPSTLPINTGLLQNLGG